MTAGIKFFSNLLKKLCAGEAEEEEAVRKEVRVRYEKVVRETLLPAPTPALGSKMASPSRQDLPPE